MIEALRRRHRRTFGLLAAAVPAALTIAVLARPPWPDGPLPSALQSRAITPGEPLTELQLTGTSPADAHGLTLELQRNAKGLLVAASIPAPAPPDLLAWWAGGEEVADLRPPAGAELLGRIAPGVTTWLPLPAEAQNTSGQVLVYSLAEDRMIGTARLGRGEAER